MLRSGERLLWKDLTGLNQVTVVNPRGQRLAGRLDLVFGGRKIKVAPQSLAEGQQVMSFISSIVGEQVSTG